MLQSHTGDQNVAEGNYMYHLDYDWFVLFEAMFKFNQIVHYHRHQSFLVTANMIWIFMCPYSVNFWSIWFWGSHSSAHILMIICVVEKHCFRVCPIWGSNKGLSWAFAVAMFTTQPQNHTKINTLIKICLIIEVISQCCHYSIPISNVLFLSTVF